MTIGRIVCFTSIATVSTFTLSYLSDTRAAIYKHCLMPLTRFIDPERAHSISITLAKYNLVPKQQTTDSSLLSINIWGKDISNPIGLAAGYDKDGEAIDAMFGFGFGIVEIGSITPLPQPGNLKPRMFRLEKDGALINRYGFNSKGSADLETRLLSRKQLGLCNNGLLGINLGKNKNSKEECHSDYIEGVKLLGKFADYLVINVSSPNTPNLRDLQKRGALEGLLSEVIDARNKSCGNVPVVVKISPDMNENELKDVADIILKVGIDGVIIGNTTLSRLNLISDVSITSEQGGLSGKPLLTRSLSVVRDFYKLTNGKVPIIGCGGISNAQDAIQFAKAGASFIQLYTSLGYSGPAVVTDIKTDLEVYLEKSGQRWSSLIGLDHE